MACEELGRVTRAYVSGYNRSRVHVSNLYGYETRCLVANFNGAIPGSRTIVGAQWQTWNNYTGFMSNPQIQALGREATILLKAQAPGPCIIKCSVTLDNGEIYVQQFRVNVLRSPMYSGDSWASGPQVVTVTV